MTGWLARLNQRLMIKADNQKRDSYVQLTYQPAHLSFCRKQLDNLEMSLNGKTILDVGCGPGEWLTVCTESEPGCLIGGDFIDNMLSVAKKVRIGNRRVPLFRGNAISIPVRSETFDLVICSLVLPYVPSDRQAISELARVCKPGGRLLISFHDLGFYMHHIFGQGHLKYLIVPPLTWLSFLTGKKMLWNTYQTLSGLKHLLDSEGCQITNVEPYSTFWNIPSVTYVAAQKSKNPD